jgi:hypothetical protein
MGCAAKATLLHAGDVKDAALEKSLGKVVQARLLPFQRRVSATMIVDRLPTWRPETTVNE